jgi:hypothetical protein
MCLSYICVVEFAADSRAVGLLKSMTFSALKCFSSTILIDFGIC